jgi:hypothetical protein
MTGKGTTFKTKYLQGLRLTPQQSILAKCSECQADYTDGRRDCEIKECPLYPFMPYGGNKDRKKSNRGPTRKEVKK